jgi:hypothetical protein
LCAFAGCSRDNKQPPAAAQPPASVEPAPVEQVSPPPPEPSTREATPRRASPATAAPSEPVIIDGVRTNADAAILADFQKRVAAYVDLKKNLDKKTPDLKETKDPIQIETAQKLLAAKIINVRKGARPGDIFTPQISTKFRQLLAPEVKGTAGRETKQELKEDVEEADEKNPKVPMKVNIEYTEGAALPTTPANVLASLPRLPEGLEYRILGRNLILRDVDANIIVDFMPNAVR